MTSSTLPACAAGSIEEGFSDSKATVVDLSLPDVDDEADDEEADDDDELALDFFLLDDPFRFSACEIALSILLQSRFFRP